jgi:hypothetical protein
VRRLKSLVKAGWYVPLADGHDLENQPRPAHQLAEDVAGKRFGTIGRVVDARQRKDGVAEFLCEVHAEKDRELLRKKCWVSPQLHESWPPQNPVWRGPTPTHLAVCERPIWTAEAGQRAFQLSGDKRPRPAVVHLGLAKRGGPMADEKDDDKGKKKDGDKGEGGGESDACPPAVIDALRESGMAIPEEAKTVNEVVVAIKASQGAASEPEAPATGAEAAPPVMMSADATRYKEELDKANGELLKVRRDGMAARIQAVYQSGRASPQKRDDWTKQLKGAVQLSADGTGKGQIPVQLVAEVAAHEGLPAGSIWSGERQTVQLGGHEAPPPDDADEDEAAIDKRVDEFIERRQGKRQRA